MKILSLGLNGANEDLRAKLQQSCGAIADEGVRIAVDETNKGNYTFLGCNIAEGELSFRNYERIKNILKTHVSQLLADMIVNKEEKILLRKIVNHNYRYFSEDERATIYNNAVKYLDTNHELFSEFSDTIRRTRISNRIQEYFSNHHELVIEGFLAFRLKDYREKLAEVVDKAVDEYMMDQEYKEFIRVLRYFVDIQEAQVEEVHVIIGEGGNFRLCDSHGKGLNNQHLEHIMLKGSDDINYEDLVISALITIAPQNVMLHYTNGHQGETLVDTVQSVFEGRVMLCTGCELCKSDSLGHFTP